MGEICLIVEEANPDEHFGELMRRISLYLQYHIDYWLIDSRDRSISVYRPGREFFMIREGVEELGDEVELELRCSLQDFFVA